MDPDTSEYRHRLLPIIYTLYALVTLLLKMTI